MMLLKRRARSTRCSTRCNLPDLDVLQSCRLCRARRAAPHPARGAGHPPGERRSDADAPRAGHAAWRRGFRRAPAHRDRRASAPARRRLAAAILRIEDAHSAVRSGAVGARCPHLMATLRFGESVELGVMGLPVVGRFAPLWALTLPVDRAPSFGSTRPIAPSSMRRARPPRFRSCMPPALLGEVEEGDPAQVAALLRITLETAAGS